MNISKISRRIIVAIFTLVIFSLCVYDIMLVLNDKTSTPFIFKILKLIYPILVVGFTTLYTYIKEKMNKLKIDRKISLTYRYIFLFVISIAYNIYMLKVAGLNLYNIFTFFFILAIVLIAVIIKKTIFNVSKSDILSVLGMGIYVFLPKIINDKALFITSILITLFVALSINFILKLIDELKQQGIKNSRYIRYSIYTGICMSISIILGFNIYVYLISMIFLFIITVNLDKTHINFPKKIFEDLSSEKREFLYKIERLNINKLIISMINILVITVGMLFLSNIIFKNINISINENAKIYSYVIDYVDNVQNYSERLTLLGYNTSLENIKINLFYMLNSSAFFYLFIYIYIFVVEMLTFILRRRYDTKTTMLKIVYIVTVIMYGLSDSSRNMINIYHNVIVFLSILLAVLNTSNIYLNREERVKLLNP